MPPPTGMWIRPSRTVIVRMARLNSQLPSLATYPIAPQYALRRLEAIALQPRAWVEGVDYVGPDRRRFNSAEHEGDLKRIADTGGPPHDVRIAEAIKIIVSALSAIERQPAQSLRALLAQTEELAAVAAEISDAALATGVAELRRYLVEAAKGGGLNAAEALRRAGVLLNQRGREAA